MYEELLDPPCWELRGRPKVSVFLSALFDLFGKDCALVLEYSDVKPSVANILSAISDRTGESETVVNIETWSGLRYEIQLGRPIPQPLVELCEHHAAPEYCSHAFVFRSGVPVLLWFDFGGEQIIIRPEIDESVIRTLAERTGLTYRKSEK